MFPVDIFTRAGSIQIRLDVVSIFDALLKMDVIF